MEARSSETGSSTIRSLKSKGEVEIGDKNKFPYLVLGPTWAEDERAFERHFDLSYEDFCKLAQSMPDDKLRRYGDILNIDQEAAILWLIKHGKSYGILKENS